MSVVGAGAFATGTLLPILARRRDVDFRGLASAGGLSAAAFAAKHGFAFSCTRMEDVLEDPNADVVVIATRHDQHASMALAALRAGKHVYLEKPLAISEDELDGWRDALAALEDGGPMLTVGFNRRFSPATVLMLSALAKFEGPRTVHLRCNAGVPPVDHWSLDPQVGGGRILGEACHCVDLAIQIVGERPVRVFAEPTSAGGACIALRFRDGSIANILYAADGDRSAGKDRIEVHVGGATAVVDDFRRVEVRRDGRRVERRSWWSAQKGHAEGLSAFFTSLQEGRPSIPYGELLAGAEATFAAVRSMRTGSPVEATPT